MRLSKSPECLAFEQPFFPIAAKTLWCALFMAFGAVANAQTSVSKLSPNPEMLRPLLQPGALAEQSIPETGLHIQILAGDQGVNIIKTKAAIAPVVEVRDRNNLPVSGAVVTFNVPSDGPSVVFLNGSRSITVIAEENGRATTVGMKPVNVGAFQISVTAASQSQVASAELSMTNVLTEGAATGVAGGKVATVGSTSHGLSGRAIGLLVGVAGAAAIGIGVGLTHHGSSSSASSATIGVGTGTVGAPH